jgi:mycothiol system anti-sigma-R factor
MSDHCQEILSDIALFLDGECGAEVEHMVAQHLVNCPPCMDKSDFERQLRALVARSCREKIPGDVLDRIRSRMAELSRQ